MNSKTTLITAAILSLLALPVPLLAATVFRLNVLDDGDAVQSGFATLVASEVVVTSAGLADQGDQWIVIDPVTGANLGASLLASDPVRDLALLRVAGLTGEPASLALEAGVIGRNVALVLDGSSRTGVLHSQMVTPEGQARIRHTALIGNDEFAAPLTNNCGAFLGISQSDRSSLFSRRLQPDAEFGFVGPLAELTAFLDQNQIEYVIENGACLSEAEQLQLAEAAAQQREQELQRLQEEQAALAAERETLRLAQEEAERRNAELTQDAQTRLEELAAREAELAAALNEIESATASVSSLEQDVSSLEQEVTRREEVLAQERQAQQQQRQQFVYLMAGSAVAGIALLALLLWQIRRRRALKQQAEALLRAEQGKVDQARDALARASATHPDILLLGQEAGGRELRVKLNGNALIRASQGQILGRSAQHADYVLNLEHVSRQHLRMSISAGDLMVEDLGTLNGSAINGRALTPGAPARLNNGDRLRVGLQEFLVTVLTDSPPA